MTAHDKLRQMPFYTSTLLEKYADLAHEDWEALDTQGAKTEIAFVDFMRNRMGLTKAAAITRVRSVIYRDILDHPGNKLREYITEENRGRANPITMSRLSRTFFAEFIAPPPLNDEFETDDWHRDEEKENVVFLLNVIVAQALESKWNPELGDAGHKKAARLFSAGALRAWVPFLHDAVAPALRAVSDGGASQDLLPTAGAERSNGHRETRREVVVPQGVARPRPGTQRSPLRRRRTCEGHVGQRGTDTELDPRE